MRNTVAIKHMQVLDRRRKYLLSLKEEGKANSFDLAEAAALRSALEYINSIKAFEEESGFHIGELVSDIEIHGVKSVLQKLDM